MPIPKNVVDKEHILKALAAIDQNGVPWHRQSTKFDLLYNEKKYPPKYAVSLAFGVATGKELHGFTGGEETNGFLKSLGFEVKEKTEGIYLLLRSNEESPWKDEHGASYHYGATVANNKKIQPGVRFLVDRRFEGSTKIIGIGEIGETSEEAPNEKGKQYRATFSRYKPLVPPRIMTEEIENRISSLPNYNQQHSIRVINAELFQELSEPARAWLFQGNPDRYDIAGALRELKEVTWSVNQYKDEIHKGDRVYYWQAGSGGGIVGVGDVLDEPRVRPPLESELKFYRDDSLRGEYLGVLIRKEKFADPPIRRDQVLAIPDLANLAIFKFANATNFPITETEAESIEKLLVAKPRRYWKIAPGEKASIWSSCVENEQGGCIRIGWPALGDLSRFSVEDDLRQAFEEQYQQKGRKWKELWEFLHIREGDVILANNGMTSIVGVGAVTKPYFFDSGLPEYPNCLGVKWSDVQERPIREDAKGLVKDWFGYTVKELTAEEFERLTTSGKGRVVSATDFTNSPGRLREIADEPLVIPSMDDAITYIQQQGFYDAERLHEAIVGLALGHLILAGPPGTGKTKLAKHLAEVFQAELLAETANPEWSVYDVVGTQSLKPDGKGTVPRHGIFFTSVLLQCGSSVVRNLNTGNSPQATWLLIDEINRAEIDRAFGPLFTALSGEDKGTYPLDYYEGGPRVTIPRRFRLICTMNDYDTRFVNSMSAALRRRFARTLVLPPENVEGKIPEPEWQVVTTSALSKVQLIASAAKAREAAMHLVQRAERIKEVFGAFRNLNGNSGIPVGTAQILDTCVYLMTLLLMVGVPETEVGWWRLFDRVLTARLLSGLESDSTRMRLNETYLSALQTKHGVNLPTTCKRLTDFVHGTL